MILYSREPSMEWLPPHRTPSQSNTNASYLESHTRAHTASESSSICKRIVQTEPGLALALATIQTTLHVFTTLLYTSSPANDDWLHSSLDICVLNIKSKRQKMLYPARVPFQKAVQPKYRKPLTLLSCPVTLTMNRLLLCCV